MQVLPPNAFSLHMDRYRLCLEYHTQHMDIYDWDKAFSLASIPTNYDESDDRGGVDLANGRTNHVDKHGWPINVKVELFRDIFFIDWRRWDVKNVRENNLV